MKLYLLKDLNDPSKYKVEERSSPVGTLMEWPNDIDQEDLPYCVITNTDGVYGVVLDQGLKDAALAEKAVKDTLTSSYKSMDDKVLADAAVLFGTDNQLSAIRQYLTFLRMSASPELYDNEGLRALFTVGTITRGDSLNDHVKIKEYADGMLAKIDQFSIQAQKEVQAFLDQKEAITGEW